MKKSLIALAALAATGAFAQSSVTLSGLLDFAGSRTSGNQAIANGTTFATTTGASSTSVIRITAVEDLGGGMRATAHFGLDPRSLANDGLSVTNNFPSSNNSAATPQQGTNYDESALRIGAAQNVATGLNRDELFVGLSGSFGNLRLGSPNSIGLTAFLTASPLGTGIGSGYAPNAGAMTMQFSNIRYSRSARFDSAVMNGFSVSALIAPGNDQVTEMSSFAGTTNATPVAIALSIPNAREVMELGVNYANGPLTVAFVNISQKTQVNPQGFYGIAAVSTGGKTDARALYANYKLTGATTLYAGWNNGDALFPNAAAPAATSGARYAVKHTIGAIDLAASYTEQKTAGVKGTVAGVRADYNLSKTAAMYMGYENWNTGFAYNDGNLLTAPYTGTRKILSAGLRKAF